METVNSDSGNDLSWKVSEQTPVTHSMGHYLMAVRDQLRDKGYARVTDISTRLDVARSSVSVMLESLREKGYLTKDENHFFQLTNRGEQVARQVYGNHLLLETFLHEILGVEQETALLDACRMEHLLSRDSSRRLLCFLHYLFDHRDQYEALIKGSRDYREVCPTGKGESCDLCQDRGECPFLLPESPHSPEDGLDGLKPNGLK